MLMVLLIAQERLQSVCANMAVCHASNKPRDPRLDWSVYAAKRSAFS